MSFNLVTKQNLINLSLNSSWDIFTELSFINGLKHAASFHISFKIKFSQETSSASYSASSPKPSHCSYHSAFMHVLHCSAFTFSRAVEWHRIRLNSSWRLIHIITAEWVMKQRQKRKYWITFFFNYNTNCVGGTRRCKKVRAVKGDGFNRFSSLLGLVGFHVEFTSLIMTICSACC